MYLNTAYDIKITITQNYIWMFELHFSGNSLKLVNVLIFAKMC